jgi:phosphinothricin acetyltransferase
MTQDCKIRIAVISDLPAIVSIYNEAINLGYVVGDTQTKTVELMHTWFEEHIPSKYPIFVCEKDREILGWCSISPYRQGRDALRFTAEISYFVKSNARRKGIATALIQYAKSECHRFQIKTLFAIILECNQASYALLEKENFQRWGFLPRVADFFGKEYGHLYYGYRLCQKIYDSTHE